MNTIGSPGVFSVFILAFIVFSDISLDASSILYATVDRGDGSSGQLYAISPTNFQAQVVGDLGRPLLGLAYDSENDVLYSVDGIFGGATHQLFSIDRTTGASTAIGPTGIVNAWGIAYNSNLKMLFATDQDFNLFTLDPQSGMATLVGNMGSFGGAASRDLTFDPNGNRLLLGVDAFGSIDEGLVAVDPSGPSLSVLGSYGGFFGVEGVAFDVERDAVLGTSTTPGTRNVLQIDKNSGQASVLGPVTGISGTLRGLGFVPTMPTIAVPEPPTLTLLGIGLMCFAAIGRHKARRTR